MGISQVLHCRVPRNLEVLTVTKWELWKTTLNLTPWNGMTGARANVSSQLWLVSSMINNPTLMSALSWLMDPPYRPTNSCSLLPHRYLKGCFSALLPTRVSRRLKSKMLNLQGLEDSFISSTTPDVYLG